MATIYSELDAQWEEVDGLLKDAATTFRGAALDCIVSQIDTPTAIREQGYDVQSKLTVEVRKPLLASAPTHDEEITIGGVVYTIRDVATDETHYRFQAYLPT